MFVGTCGTCGDPTFSWDEFNEHVDRCGRIGTGQEPWHGKITGYTEHHCRCQRCRRAKADRERADRAANPEKHRAWDRSTRQRRRLSTG